MATNEENTADKARMISQHGQKGKHNHLIEGRNSRMDGLHAAILLAKLPYLEQWTEARIQRAAFYSSLLKEAGVDRPVIKKDNRHVFHLYVVRCAGDSREKIQAALSAENIETAIHYPSPLPFLACYKHRNFKDTDYPVAHAYQSQILSLPIYPELTEESISRVAEIINKFSSIV
jgi:dTDP-4-amino-4,6-dideoxygalactose transaminase